MSGQRIEQIPKNFDFAAQVERVSQVLSFESVSGFIDQRMGSIEDSMMVTGLRMTSHTQGGVTQQGFPSGHSNQGHHNPNDTYTSDTRHSVGTASA